MAAEYRAWDDGTVDWSSYDRVVIRSTWNYTAQVDAFVAWARSVGAERLRNHPELVAFNVDKRYLEQLDARVVPTLFVAPGDPPPALEGELVVKPSVSAGARDTGRFGPETHRVAAELIEQIQTSGRTALVQPYMRGVDERGEAALVFFNGRFSHSLRKRAVLAADEIAPATDGELGVAVAMLADDLVVAGPCSAAERAFAEQLIAEVSDRFATPLYARVDLVNDADGPMLLELEAVEPNLYMELVPGAAERFAAALRAG